MILFSGAQQCRTTLAMQEKSKKYIYVYFVVGVRTTYTKFKAVTMKIIVQVKVKNNK